MVLMRDSDYDVWGSWGTELTIYGGKVHYWVVLNGSGYELVSAMTLVPGEWYHVVGQYTGSAREIWIDGVRDASAPASGALRTGPYPTYIGNGHWWEGWGTTFDGGIGEVALYDHALPAERLQAHKEKGKPKCDAEESDTEECNDPGPFETPNPPERCRNHDPIASRPPGGTGDTYERLLGQGLYVLRDPLTRDIRYVGRGDVPRRLAQHLQDPEKSGLDQLILANNNLCYEEARGLEQKVQDVVKERNILKRLVPALLNRIRGISLNNPRIQQYLAAAERLVAEAISIMDSYP
jgi:hypothetical protein